MHKLQMKDLELMVHLGCLPDERVHAQLVRLSVDITFSHPPMACGSDELEHTVCYAKMAEVVTDVSSQKEFKTVEHLAFECFHSVKKTVPRNVILALEICKVNPPVPHLRGGVVYRIEDPYE